MRWNYFVLFVILLVSLSSITALAESVVETSPVKNQISLSEEASFKLTITNRESVKQRYSVYSLQSGQGWNVDPFPFEDRFITIGPGQKHSTTIKARPLEDFTPGIYYVHVNVESDLGERFNEALKVYLSPDKPLEYLPSIKTTLDMDEKINPRDPVSIKLFLENKNPLDLKNLQISIQSDIPEFVKEITVDLPPLEQKTVEFTITPSEFQQPKEYMLFFVFKRGEQTVKVLDKRIEILPLLPEFDLESNDETIYLKKFTWVTITNNGNVLNTQKARLPLPFWQALFARSEGSSIEKLDGQRYLVWQISLAPGESASKQVITNYRLAVYILIVLLIILLFYLYAKSSVIINKKATTTKGHETNALSQLKITLEVKNRSHQPLKNISVIDLVPTIANVEKSLELGTLRPKEVRHTKRGTKVIWALAELGPLEHRLITYKVKSKLNILGTFSLPRAIVKYTKGKSRKRKAYSNVFRVGN